MLVVVILLAAGAPAQAQMLNAFTLDIVVRSEAGYPIEGARIRVEPLDWEAHTDPDGRVEWRDVSTGQAFVVSNITIEADGYGTWTYRDLRLVAGVDLLLAPILEETPAGVTIPRPEYAWFSEPNPDDLLTLQQIFDNIDLTSPLPEEIRLRIVDDPLTCDPDAPYTLKTVNFLEYVRNVLPNEWAAEWNQEALKAGAVAVKMYAWYWISRGGKWGDADLMNSTCDQVYIPNSDHPRTDAAIKETWGYRMERAGDLFQTQHLRICHLPSCMDQDLSLTLAWQGYTWKELLAHFYPGSALSDEGYPYILYTYLPAIMSEERR